MSRVLPYQISINLDLCQPGTLPVFVDGDLPGLCRMSFDDAAIWLRKDQLRELYGVVLAALYRHEKTPDPSQPALPGMETR